ncbi:hypothetical protein EDB85DRAFT_297367 [Lactarius pseudohatsudake]|nr:hypothetical protein EDB85DRAFT_297367 [Lactarius pseudohatsudake]
MRQPLLLGHRSTYIAATSKPKHGPIVGCATGARPGSMKLWASSRQYSRDYYWIFLYSTPQGKPEFVMVVFECERGIWRPLFAVQHLKGPSGNRSLTQHHVRHWHPEFFAFARGTAGLLNLKLKFQFQSSPRLLAVLASSGVGNAYRTHFGWSALRRLGHQAPVRRATHSTLYICSPPHYFIPPSTPTAGYLWWTCHDTHPQMPRVVVQTPEVRILRLFHNPGPGERKIQTLSGPLEERCKEPYGWPRTLQLQGHLT